jgi:hypothetical protein
LEFELLKNGVVLDKRKLMFILNNLKRYLAGFVNPFYLPFAEIALKFNIYE